MKNNIKFPLFKFIVFSYKCYKSYFLVVILCCLFKAGELVYNAYSLSILISYLEKGDYKTSMLCGLIIVLINFLFYFLNKLASRLVEVGLNKLEKRIDEVISRKLMNMPFQNLEDPDCLDLKERARMGLYNFDTINSIVTNLFNIIQNAIVIISLGVVIVSFDYRLVIVLIVTVVFNVLFILLSINASMKFFMDLIPLNRKFSYYIDTIFDDKKGKDYRMYKNIGEMLEKQYISYEKQTLSQFNKLFNKTCFSKLGQKIVNYIELALIYIIIIVRVSKGGVSIASFSLYVSSAIAITKAIIDLINGNIDLSRCSQYIIPLLQLLDFSIEDGKDGTIKLNDSIYSLEFKNVFFKYPKSKNLILDNVSFKINKGEKISIVGLNGAGKTTIVKLIARLYKPISGGILINGININDYEYKSYIKQISAVFQDFKLFAYTLKENILNGDGSEKDAYDVIKLVGLKEKVDSLPKGINTLYTKSYDDDGVELSGGEAQKIAIARALYANSSLVILDEPTSALDPLAEADIYQNFNKLVKNKTAIYISHRMSSSIFCDKILVLNGGKVESYDTHLNLMKDKDSLYYKLFNAQAINYAE